MNKDFVVGIVGAGIGGVTLARTLWKNGIPFQLFDQAPEFGEVGAGIQITPNAVKVLHDLGLKKELKKDYFLPESMVGKNWDDGKVLFRTQIKNTFDRLFGAPYYQMHRADLHEALVKDLPEECVNFNSICLGVEESKGKSKIIFDDGSEFEADLVVGADGIRSNVRESIWGKDDPTFTGHMCWRALVPVEEFPLSFVHPGLTIWFGPHGHVVTYYVRNGREVNIVAVKETENWEKESWTVSSSTDELVGAFEKWHPDVVKLLRLTDNNKVFKWGLFDRQPMEQWSSKNTTLLGDAAHPMLPYLSQGAAMATEDGYILAEALSHFNCDISSSLQAYEKERVERTRNVQLASRERGVTYHLDSEEKQKERNRKMKQREKENKNAVGINSEWVYEYDPIQCHTRFSNFEWINSNRATH